MTLVDPRIREEDFEVLAVSSIYLVQRLSKMSECLVTTKFNEERIKKCAFKMLVLF